MQLADHLKERLHRFKRKLKYQESKRLQNVHMKKTQLPMGLSTLPANRLPGTLREEVTSASFTEDILEQAGNIEHFCETKACSCDCHDRKRIMPGKEPVFHNPVCIEYCGSSNKDYEKYLSNTLRSCNNQRKEK